MFRPCWNIDTERNNKTGKLHHELEIFALLRLTFPNLSFFAAEEFPVVQLCKQSWFWETSVVTEGEGRGLSNFSFYAFCFFGGEEVQNNADHNLFNCPAYVRYFCQVMFSFHFGQFLTFITNFCHFIISYRAVGKVFLSIFFCHLWW